MPLDFAQVDERGDIVGPLVRLDRGGHMSIIRSLAPDDFPFLARMRDYYDDLEYSARELPSLRAELQRCLESSLSPEDGVIVRAMLELVVDSEEKGLSVEAIAD